MEKFLYRCTIDYTWQYKGKKGPVYVVASSKEEAEKYVESMLKYDCKVKSVSKLGAQLSGILFK